MSYEETLNYLEKLSIFGVRLGLGRIENLLSRLNNPERKYKTIHITGTNGKGSAARFIAASLTACGIKTALYTSPHLEKYEERMEIDGKLIPREDFAKVLSEIKIVVEDMVKTGEECPTQFEVLTAMAFLYFAKQNVEYAVIEVGLGGLLDSTNVITPIISVITNVTFEHADKCGGTLEGVTKHKAGIIKETVTVVTGAKDKPLQIIKAVAAEKSSKIFVLNEDFFVKTNGENLIFFDNGKNINYALNMKAIYQRENSAIALKTLKLLAEKESRINLEKVLEAFKNTTHAGRFEEINGIILDGAHNPAGSLALRESLDYFYKNSPKTFLIGILKDKQVENILKNLIREEDSVIITKPNSERAMSEDELAEKVKKFTANVKIAKNPLEGLQFLKEANSVKIITGSLYLIGFLRETCFCGLKR